MEMARKECEDEKTRRKRKKADRFVSLPDDMVLEILKRVPDVFLRYKAKHVCRRWLDIISNRILLDHSSFIIQKIGKVTARHVDIREEEQGLQVKEQKIDIPSISMSMIIKSWCNEFLLISDYRRGSLYVYNLITKKGSYLPECNESCDSKCSVALSFDGFKGIYKVVHLYMIASTIQCHMLILGKDAVSPVTSKWKDIQVFGIILNKGHRYQYCGPISVQSRYFHWDFYYSNDLVSVDMVKEKNFYVSLPRVCDPRFCSFSVMDGFLALVDGASRPKTDIWVLKDPHRVKWEKLYSPSLDDYYFERNPGSDNAFVYRVFGMINKRYIILTCRARLGMYSYDLKNGVVKKLNISIDYRDDYERCVVHSSAPSFI